MHKRAAYDLAIGLTLRQLSEERGTQRADIAAALEATELAVTRFEIGEENVSAGGLILLLKLFDIPWDAFLERVTANLPIAESEII